MLPLRTIYHLYVIYKLPLRPYRHEHESDTADTDSESGWGGLGMFEKSLKGLPHALKHAPELVMTFGHHGGVCTCVGEAGHKLNIKGAAKFARTYGDRNLTQNGMQDYVNRDQLYIAVNCLNCQFVADNVADNAANVSSQAEDTSDPETHLLTHGTSYKLRDRLPYTDGWHTMRPVDGKPPPAWGSKFLSRRVLITRNELLVLLRTKLKMRATWVNVVRLANKVEWECFGNSEIGLIESPETRRKVVGISSLSPQRRDFVRLMGSESNTALGAQVIMFIRVNGFRHAGIPVPESLRVPANNTCNHNSVVLALVRWLVPDPRALLRDSEDLPVCPPPFGTNHALWKFAKTTTQRGYFTDHMFTRQLHLFPGSDLTTRRRNARSLDRDRYGLIQLETIDKFMNCTTIDNDNDSVLQTVTLPFESSS